MALLPQQLPWTALPNREISDGAGNIVQFTVANLGLMCLAANSHDKLKSAVDAATAWLRTDPASRAPESEILSLLTAASGRIGFGILAGQVEGLTGAAPEFDRKIANELQIPEATYTGSIDAALSLVPQGWAFSFSIKEQLDPSTGQPGNFNMVEMKAPDGRVVTGTSSVLPLAICGAALKARE